MKLRLGWPLLAYFFIVSPSVLEAWRKADLQSLWFTLIERAWQIPFTDYLGSG